MSSDAGTVYLPVTFSISFTRFFDLYLLVYPAVARIPFSSRSVHGRAGSFAIAVSSLTVLSFYYSEV